MKADIAKVGDAVGKLIAALTVLLTTGNTAEFTGNTERKRISSFLHRFFLRNNCGINWVTQNMIPDPN